MKKCGFMSLLILCSMLAARPTTAQDYKTGAQFVRRDGITYLHVTSMGTSDMRKAVNRVQACLMAKSAAEGLAKAELAEELGKLHVSKGKTIKNAVAESEVVATAFQGYLQGAVVVSSDCRWEMDSPVGTATVGIALTGENAFMGQMYKTAPGIMLENEPAPSGLESFSASVGEKGVPDRYDGLILDASALRVKPDTHVLIETQKGLVAYSAKSVDPEVLIRELMIAYAGSEEHARGVLKEKGSSTPMVVRPISVQNGSEYIVSTEDALKIATMNERGDALQKARVVIVTG